VRHERVVLVSDPEILLPASSLPQSTARLIAAIHPDLAEEAAEIARP
jgi:hypothetical protein